MKYLFILCLLSGCVDRGECLQSHKEIVMIPQYFTTCAGNGQCTTTLYYFLPVEETVCDKWEFPEGKSKSRNDA